MAKSYRPQLTDAAKPSTFEVEAVNERGEMVPTAVAGEHPLTLYLDKKELVTLMTLGHAPEALAIGYLRNQRLVGALKDITAVQVDWETDSCAVTTRKGVKNLKQKTGRRTVTSGCGQGTMFGSLMDEIDLVKLRKDVTLSDEQLFALIEKVRKYETIYKQAGAVHGCALASREGEILMFVEDVGRHNAVDADRRLHVAGGHRRLGQGVLHHGPPHFRDGDQVRADAHPVPRVALGPDADGPPDCAKDRHHHARPRQRPALPRLHRPAAPGEDRSAAHRHRIGERK